MPTRIRILKRIVQHIRVPIETLRISRIGHNGISRNEPPQRRVVEAGIVVVEAKPGLVTLPREPIVGGEVLRATGPALLGGAERASVARINPTCSLIPSLFLPNRLQDG
jgi:hypothetical protein